MMAYPDELKQLRQFVVWKMEPRPGETKPTKVPYNPRTGGMAMSNNAGTWGSFDEAVSALKSNQYSGIGFEFSPPYVGIDLDKCRNAETGDIEVWAKRIVEAFGSYTEISPSKTGLHIFVKGSLPGKGINRNVSGKKIEMYDTGRFFTLTGDHLPDTPLEINEKQYEIESLYTWVIDKTETKKEDNNGQSKTENPLYAPEDDEIIEKLLNEKEDKARDLWTGSSKLYDGSKYPYPSASEARQALINKIVFYTRDRDQIDRIFRRSGLYTPKWERSEIREIEIDKALSFVNELYDWDASKAYVGNPQIRKDELPQLNAGIQNLNLITEQAWHVLEAANNPTPWLFRTGGYGVRLESDDKGQPILREITSERLRHELAKLARWYVLKQRGNSIVEADAKPPVDVIKNMLARPDLPLPVLTRIVGAPIFSPQGEIETRPGYHPVSRTYYSPSNGLHIPNVSKIPTQVDIYQALELIFDQVLVDFPFSGKADKAHAIGLMLLPYVRSMISDPTPLHLIEATGPGTGKGLLAFACTSPSVGANIGVVTQAKDGDEWRKQITSRLREGHSVIQIDNITRPIDSGELAAALTANVWSDRILGKSETISLPVECVWIATANNPVMSTEIARRCVRIRLDAKIDRPWQREGFTHPNLRGWITENRSQLIWSSLVLIQSWIAAGQPAPKSKPLGSYERWSNIIGGVLEYAGVEGFLTNLDEFYETADLEGTMWRQFTAEWYAEFKDQQVTTTELFPLAEKADYFTLEGKSEKALRTAFGMALTRQRDRVIGDYRVEKVGIRHKAATWRLCPVTERDR